MRKFDLLVGLLILASIIAAAMTLDPKGFSLKEWQPLLAAIIALIGASVVYASAMAKVDLDREIHERAQRRATRGLFLRTDFAMHTIGHSAAAWATAIRTSPPSTALNPADIILVEVSTMEEIWSQLDAYPKDIAGTLADLKIAIANFDRWKARLNAGTIPSPPPKAIIEICDMCDLIAPLCVSIRSGLEKIH